MRAQITFEFSLVELEGCFWISARDFGVSSRTDIMTLLASESWELSGCPAAGLDIAIIITDHIKSLFGDTNSATFL